jgi:hypothetical protein
MLNIYKRSFVLSLIFVGIFSRCANNDINDLQKTIDCSNSTLSVKSESVTDASNCKAIDGKITVSAEGGTSPYDFTLNGGASQTSTEFSNLGQGTYTIMVKDASNCTKSLEVVIIAPDTNLNATAQMTGDSECLTNNGAATITATGGQSPYLYQIDAGGFTATNSFTGLNSGSHAIIVKDANECQKILSIDVPRNATGISYSGIIAPIIKTNCSSESGCHGANSINGDWTKYDNVFKKSALIKKRTGDRSMPANGNTLSQEQINQIACWVDDGALNN